MNTPPSEKGERYVVGENPTHFLPGTIVEFTGDVFENLYGFEHVLKGTKQMLPLEDVEEIETS